MSVDHEYKERSTHRFDAVSVVDCKLWVIARLIAVSPSSPAVGIPYLDTLVDDTIDYSQGIEIELNTFRGTIGNLLILLVKVGEECRAIVTSVTLSPQVKLLGFDGAVQLGQSAHKALHDFPGGRCGEFGGI